PTAPTRRSTTNISTSTSTGSERTREDQRGARHPLPRCGRGLSFFPLAPRKGGEGWGEGAAPTQERDQRAASARAGAASAVAKARQSPLGDWQVSPPAVSEMPLKPQDLRQSLRLSITVATKRFCMRACMTLRQKNT